MYSKFNYLPTDSFFTQEIMSYLEVGKTIYSNQKREIQQPLNAFITKSGIIDGTKLKEHWFSISPKDVFISHSHKNLNEALALAGWLHECFGLESFIDSCFWGYCDDLLREIDNQYCYNDSNNTYNYKSRNYSTSHVHMMLSTAITEMMDSVESVIFVNTPQSISLPAEYDKIKRQEKTISPWIYHELSMMTMLRPRHKERQSLMHEDYSIRDSMEIEYDIHGEIKNLTPLSDVHLRKWSENWQKRYEPLRFPEEALDELYKIVFPKG